MNALHERYAQLKILITQKNDELRHLYETKVQLKQQIILQELQELPRDYKETLKAKLARLKGLVESPCIEDARYAFVFIQQPVDHNKIPIRDPIDWQIIEYTMDDKRYVEIAIGVSKVSVSMFVRDWIAANIPGLEHSRHLYTMTVEGSEEYND
jgi:hypothetical protein